MILMFDCQIRNPALPAARDAAQSTDDLPVDLKEGIRAGRTGHIVSRPAKQIAVELLRRGHFGRDQFGEAEGARCVRHGRRLYLLLASAVPEWVMPDQVMDRRPTNRGTFLSQTGITE